MKNKLLFIEIFGEVFLNFSTIHIMDENNQIAFSLISVKNQSKFS